LNNSEPDIDLADEAATAAPPEPIHKNGKQELVMKNGSGTAAVIVPKMETRDVKLQKPNLSSPPTATSVTEPIDVPVVPVEDGMYLGKGTVVVLALLAIVLIGLAFATGFMIGQ
jgi:hypothetical protein